MIAGRLFNLVMITASIIMHAHFSGDSIPKKWRNHYFDIIQPKVAAGGRYVFFNKLYTHNADTVALVDRRFPGVAMRQFPKGRSAAFTHSHNFFIISGTDAELLFLPSRKKKCWGNVSDGAYLPWLNRIALLQGDQLLVLDEYGKLMRTIPNVVNIKKVAEDDLVFVTKSAQVYDLRRLSSDGSHLLLSSNTPTMLVSKMTSDQFIIFEKKGSHSNLYFKDVRADSAVLFRPPFGMEIRSAFSKPIQMDSNRVYLNLVVNTAATAHKNKVEVWYGNDRDIDHQFFDYSANKIVVWNHKTGKAIMLQDAERRQVVFTGHSRYLLSFDRDKNKDFIKKRIPFTLYRYDLYSQEHEFLAEAGSDVFVDPTGRFLITLRDEVWKLVDIERAEEFTIPVKSNKRVYFSDDGTEAVFENDGLIDVFDIRKHQVKQFLLPQGFSATLANGGIENLSPGQAIYGSSYRKKGELLFHLRSRWDNQNAIAIFNGKNFNVAVPPTTDYLSNIGSAGNSKFLFTQSNINKPPQIWFRGKGDQLLFDSKSQDPEAGQIRSEWITSINAVGKELRGILIYPKNFDKTKRYPMVVSIYQSQRFESNQYLRDGMQGTTEGVNSRQLIENDYFVFLPEIIFDERGTGRSALDCVHSSLDSVVNYPFIDFSKIALVGHSHGGYEVNFIATQSNRFATFVGGAGNSDLVRSYHSYNYQWNGPFYWQFESGQYQMPGPFSKYKAIYIENSPVYYANQVTKPVLLWTGKEDQNILWEQTMEFYLALRRNDKKVIALFYPFDDHSLQKTENRVDLYGRIYDWLDFHLKGIKCNWIEEMYR